MSEYEERKRAGKVAVMVWVDEDVAEELTALMAAREHTKTRVVEDAIQLYAEVVRKRAAGANVAPARRPPAPPEDDEEEEDAPSPQVALARQVVPEGSPAAIAARVLANGARRGGTIVATGERSEGGRIRRD